MDLLHAQVLYTPFRPSGLGGFLCGGPTWALSSGKPQAEAADAETPGTSMHT